MPALKTVRITQGRIGEPAGLGRGSLGRDSTGSPKTSESPTPPDAVMPEPSGAGTLNVTVSVPWGGDTLRTDSLKGGAEVRAFRIGRELAERKRQYPGPFKLGEELAEDRFETLPREDRAWSLDMVGDYLREVGEDAVRIVVGLARREGREMETGALSTVGIACGVTLDPVVRKYISSGAAAGDRQAIAEYRTDYDRGREMADTTFFPESKLWLATAPLISNGIALRMDDTGMAGAFAFNAFSPPFGQTGVALGGFEARMAELIRHYLTEDAEDLRARSEKAAARRAEYKKVSDEVEAEFRAKGNYSGAEMIAETNRRVAQRADKDE